MLLRRVRISLVLQYPQRLDELSPSSANPHPTCLNDHQGPLDDLQCHGLGKPRQGAIDLGSGEMAGQS